MTDSQTAPYRVALASGRVLFETGNYDTARAIARVEADERRCFVDVLDEQGRQLLIASPFEAGR